MKTRFDLINAGLYPETLPPCFISLDSKRAFHGIVSSLDDSKFHERKTEYIRYNGTKHDGSRRFFGTPNIISYFHTSSFIWKNWRHFQYNFRLSKYSIGTPEILKNKERAIKVPSLSELSKHASKNIRHAPFILKADIAQCFPSLYTHAIAWAAHGINPSKEDTDRDSKSNYFNALDFFVRNGQRGNTRGVLVGPDGFRLIAEFILSRIDCELAELVGEKIVGAVRHVDDYYIGLKTEHDAESVLSTLRELLATYELNLNDQKTRIYSSLEPINDLWAQRLRRSVKLSKWGVTHDDVEVAISEAVEACKNISSESPIKILLRSFDDVKIYSTSHWDFVEHNLQRIAQKHPHAVDYVCLLVAKRHALDQQVDAEGWKSVAEMIVKRGLALSHDHEVLWMAWLMVVLSLDMSPEMIDGLLSSRNSHIRAFVVQAFVDGHLKRRPKLGLGNALSSVDSNWLTNLVSRSQGYSKASFSGLLAGEFSHLADRNIKLIDFAFHVNKIKSESRAISRTRYGYDDDSDDEYDDIFSPPGILSTPSLDDLPDY